MKITGVVANNHRHVFEVQTRSKVFTFPYSKVEPSPSTLNRIVEILIDPELGQEGFTYKLTSGAEGSIHIDNVLEYNSDPSHMADLALYKLTVEAREKFEVSGLSAREVARLLGTSTTQLYRLLDTTNYSKPLRQMILLLWVLGFEVDLNLREVTNRSPSEPAHHQRQIGSTYHVRKEPTDGVFRVKKPSSGNRTSRKVAATSLASPARKRSRGKATAKKR
ncbi:MAG TPA: hypothetical protein VNE42_03025 [Acidimicrobiales bacterium]|nr:hypothetical protein [Acidimicrobiales bacterium]